MIRIKRRIGIGVVIRIVGIRIIMTRIRWMMKMIRIRRSIVRAMMKRKRMNVNRKEEKGEEMQVEEIRQHEGSYCLLFIYPSLTSIKHHSTRKYLLLE
jgi:hypothetical protein